MYDNYVSVFGITLCTIVSIAKKYILIAAIINYQIGAKARNYIENTSFSKILFKVPTLGISGLFLNSENSEYKTFLIGPLNLLF